MKNGCSTASSCWVPALCNTLFGVHVHVCTLAPHGAAHRGGVVWIVSPVMEVLPFEFPGIRPREVAVVTSLVKTCSGLGFALGPMVVGLVAQLTGSLQQGLLVLCGLTGVGVLAGWWYPSQQDAEGAWR